jgi:3-oxoadipate enol-lactonase
MIDSRTVNVEGARVAYRMQGNGPPIVLVNGTAALDVHWGPVIPALAKQWTVISLDYSGSGLALNLDSSSSSSFGSSCYEPTA